MPAADDEEAVETFVQAVHLGHAAAGFGAPDQATATVSRR
jgi:hypothetical protein